MPVARIKVIQSRHSTFPSPVGARSALSCTRETCSRETMASSSGNRVTARGNARSCRKEGATVDWIFRRWGRSLTVPSLTSLPISDRHCFLACGRSDQAASSLRTEDQSALKDPVVPWGLQCRAGRPGVLLPVEVGPGFPWGSLVFLFCSFGASAGGPEWNSGRRNVAFTQVRDLWHRSG